MARLYSNENFPLPVVEHLRTLGHNVLTTHETGKADQAVPDSEVLKFASSENCAHPEPTTLYPAASRECAARGDHRLHVRRGFCGTGAADSQGHRRAKFVERSVDSREPAPKISVT